jgi:chromosome segregation ATPase
MFHGQGRQKEEGTI